MSASSQVDICNNAILKIGANPISALSQNVQAALVLTRIYDMILDEVLGAHPWGFCTVITTLAEISGEVVPGWEYLYTYPAEALEIRKVFSNAEDPNPTADDFRPVVSPTSNIRAIAGHYSPAYVEYTKRVTDPALYDALFVEALSCRLAAELAIPVKGETKLAVDMRSLYLFTLSEARRKNKREERVDKSKASSFKQARA